MRSLINYPFCRVPVKVFGGDRDLAVNNAAHGQVAAGLMPQADFTWLSGIGHMSHHFAQTQIRQAALDLASGRLT